MKLSLRRLARVLVLSFAVAGIAFNLAFAQSTTQNESITMSPTSSKYTIDAGKAAEDKLTIVNDGNTDYDFLVYARPYSIQDNNYQNPNFTATPANADLYAWVQFPQTKFHAKAGQTIEVKYSIHVPAGAAPGGHYGVLFAETQPDDTQTGNSVVRKKRVGSIIYATVNGKFRNTGEVAGSSIPFWQVQPPLHTTVAAKNTGNADFADETRLTVKDVFGNVKYDISKTYQVLPDTTRTINLDWDQASWFGFYKVETQQKFLDQTVKNEGYVLLMPRYMPIALLVVLVIGGLYAYFGRRKSKK